MIQALTEADVIQFVANELEDQGYEVWIEPTKGDMPIDLGSYRPDLIAIKGAENLVVEVRRFKSRSGEDLLERIRIEVEEHPGWKFRVHYMSDSKYSRGGPRPARREDVQNALLEVEELTNHRHFRAAFLLCWATFEAQARRINHKSFQRPQSPGRVIAVLTESAQISNDQASALRSLAAKRNALIHGDLSTSVSEADVETLLTVLKMLDKNWAPPN